MKVLRKFVGKFLGYVNVGFTNSVDYSYDSVSFKDASITRDIVHDCTEKEFLVRLKLSFFSGMFRNRVFLISFSEIDSSRLILRLTYTSYKISFLYFVLPILGALLLLNIAQGKIVESLLSTIIVAFLIPKVKYFINIVEWSDIEKIVLNYLNLREWSDAVYVETLNIDNRTNCKELTGQPLDRR